MVTFHWQKFLIPTWSQVCIEILYVFLQSLLYAVLLFTMIGFGPGADKFFWFFYFTFMNLMIFTIFGMMIVSITPNYQVAAILSAFFFTLWNMFTGFIMPRLVCLKWCLACPTSCLLHLFRKIWPSLSLLQQIPIWWRWYYWATPLAWTTYGFVESQLGDKDSMIVIPGEPSMYLEDYLRVKLGYEHSFLGYAAVAPVVFFLIFFLIFTYAIKYLNFQKR